MRKKGITMWVLSLSIITVLVSGAIFTPIPFAIADDHDDDKKEKLKELKEKIKKALEKKKTNDKCPEKFKYGELCDKKKPKIDIDSPQKRSDVIGSAVTISGTASDDLSGVKKVQVKIDGGGYTDATFNEGVWEFNTNLDPGRHFVFSKAIDYANNVKRDFTFFDVIIP